MNDEIIKAVMARVFEVPVETITDDVQQGDIDNWDSIHHLQLVVALDRELDISIPFEKASNMISFKLIKAVIDECKA